MKKITFILSLLCALCACSSDDEDQKDMTYPVISDEGITANPVECQQYKRGDVIPFNYIFTDDTELGSFNIEIHDNFNHHTHSGSAVECEQEAYKDPVKPWIYNKDFTIPSGLTKYNARFDIQIPDTIDTGDYHFMVRLTDQASWTELKAVAIKIVE